MHVVNESGLSPPEFGQRKCREHFGVVKMNDIGVYLAGRPQATPRLPQKSRKPRSWFRHRHHRNVLTKVEGGRVWGRGAGDQEGAIPAMVYAAKILRDLNVDLSEFWLLLTFTVMEEDCDGLCWQYIVKEDKIRPDVVVVTEPTICWSPAARSAKTTVAPRGAVRTRRVAAARSARTTPAWTSS